MDELKFGKLTYLVKYPEGFSKTEKHPILIFLHGAGSRGTSTDALRNNPFFKCIEPLNLPFVIVAPLCSENTWFDLFEHLKELGLVHRKADGYKVLVGDQEKMDRPMTIHATSFSAQARHEIHLAGGKAIKVYT